MSLDFDMGQLQEMDCIVIEELVSCNQTLFALTLTGPVLPVTRLRGMQGAATASELGFGVSGVATAVAPSPDYGAGAQPAAESDTARTSRERTAMTDGARRMANRRTTTKHWSPSLRRGRMVSRGATVDVAGQRVRDVDANVIGRLLKCSALVRLDLSVRLCLSPTSLA